MFRILLLVLALQASPQIHWKSEVRQTPDGTNQLVLTGDLDEGIDHVTGTVTYMPCLGEACYLPVDWDFEAYFTVQRSGGGRGLGNFPLRGTPPTDEIGGPLPLTKPRVATVAGGTTLSGQLRSSRFRAAVD